MELTTGQMIDQLKVGEVAEKYSVSGTETAHYVTKIESGIIGFSNKDGENVRDIHSLNSFFLKSKWKILPRYVAFEEALSALKDGKTVIYHDDGILHEITPQQAEQWNIRSLSINDHGLLHLYDGKWTVED